MNLALEGLNQLEPYPSVASGKTKMNKRKLTLIGMFSVSGLAADTVHADSITYGYKYVISGPTNLPVSPGTLTLTPVCISATSITMTLLGPAAPMLSPSPNL